MKAIIEAPEKFIDICHADGVDPIEVIYSMIETEIEMHEIIEYNRRVPLEEQ